MTSQPDDYDYREEGESLSNGRSTPRACAWAPANYWTACSRSSSI